MPNNELSAINERPADILGKLGGNVAENILIDQPNEKQQEFLLSRKRFVAYGGARGGGKSWAVRAKAILLSLKYSGIRILFLRRTLPEIRENHINPLLTLLRGVADYKESEKAFTFKNGSRIKFGYCDSERDVLQYQGQEYDVLFLDEATQFTEFQYNTLTACIRGANTHPKRIYLTCNPGGIGHAWVKRLFIDKRYKPTEDPDDYEFISARVYDNKALIANDTGYVKMLENLPFEMRRAWLDGDWNVFIGQYFTEWQENLHTIKPFTPPSHWKRFFTMDYGLDMMAGYWIAIDDNGFAYVYRELYESNLIGSEAAARIKELTQGEKIDTYFAPGDLWNRRNDTGKSIAEIFADYGILLTKTSNSRVAGWMDLHEWLKPISAKDKDGEDVTIAGIRFFNTCSNIIRCLPLLQFDTHRVNDTSSQPHELTHAPDAIRYFVAGRPHPNKPQIVPLEPLEKYFSYKKKDEKPLGEGGSYNVI